MRSGLFLLLLLLLGLSASGQQPEYVEILIQTDPPGAVISVANRQLGLSGTPFKYKIERTPGSGVLPLRVEKEGFDPCEMRFDLNQARLEGKPVLEYPRTPLQLQPANLRGYWELYRWHIAVVTGLLIAVAVVLRRNKQLKQESFSRESRVARLQDQIKSQHEFAMARIGRYRILDELGEGGIAKVYRAVPDESLDESEAVAIKILHPHLCKDGDHTQRFIREGRVSKDLSHPNIVRLSELDKEGDVVYLVLELLRGETLKDKIRKGTLSLGYARRLLSQVFGGLAYAHAQGVVHRDLTPANVMVLGNDQVKLMDFGLARRREMGHTITVTGVVQGTPGYMAPEQLKEELDARSDQYSLGVIMFEMLTGRRPIERSDAMQLIMATYTEDAPDPRQFNPQIPPPVAELILKMLQRNPDDRFASMEEAADAFAAAFVGVPTV